MFDCVQSIRLTLPVTTPPSNAGRRGMWVGWAESQHAGLIQKNIHREEIFTETMLRDKIEPLDVSE